MAIGGWLYIVYPVASPTIVYIIKLKAFVFEGY